MKRSFWLAVLAFIPALASAAPSEVDDRLTAMVSGATLTDSDDGGGASIGWLHNFNSSAILGVSAEYQTIANAHWSFGSLNLSFGRGAAENRTTFYAEGHVGSGNDTGKSFDYAQYAAGVIQSVTHQLSFQLEDKQIDIDTTHGNLPKAAVQYLWSPRVLTTLSYSHSVTGNLGTRLGSARFDYYGKGYNIIAGGAGGKASPDILNLQGVVVAEGQTLREGFAGVGKNLSRVDLTLLGDYIKLGETERVTVTLNAIVHLRTGGGK